MSRPYKMSPEAIRLLRATGLYTLSELADLTGLSRSTVKRHTSGMGRRKARTKVSQTQIEEILMLRNQDGYTIEMLAEKYGMSVSGMGKLLLEEQERANRRTGEGN